MRLSKIILKVSMCLVFLVSHRSEVLGQSDSLWHDVQNLHITQADSAIRLAYHKLKMEVKANDFDNLSQGQNWIGTSFLKINLDSALVHAALSLAYAKKADQPILLAKAYQLRGTIENRRSELDLAVENFKKGLAALEKEKDIEQKRYINIYELLLRGISTSCNYLERNDEAMSYGLKALEFARLHSLDQPELAGLIAISSLHYKVKDMGEAKRYMHEALRKSVQQNNQLGASKCYANLAIYHSAELHYDSAEFYQNKAIQINRAINSLEGLTNNYVALGMIKFETGRVEEALGHFLEAEGIAKAKKFDLQLYEILVDLAMAYNRLNRHSEALVKADELIVLAKSRNRSDKVVRGYRQRYEALYGTGRYKEAVESLEKSIALADSIKQDENQKNLQRLLVKYESEKKEEEIKRITSEAEVKDLLIRQRNIQLVSVAFGVIALLFVSFLVFRSYRVKNELELLDLKQRFYRAQINPHFLFNALGSIQGFFYDRTDPNKAAGYLARLSKLMRQILENSFDNEVSLKEEVTLMENYLEIQKVRLNDGFDYKINMDEELGDISIPSMITQPFLENSIEHGFKDLKERKATIIVNISEESGTVWINIIDNGTGLMEKKTNSDHRSRAMDITRERLSLLEKVKGKKANFAVLDNRTTGGVGVTVKIGLPA